MVIVVVVVKDIHVCDSSEYVYLCFDDGGGEDLDLEKETK